VEEFLQKHSELRQPARPSGSTVSN